MYYIYFYGNTIIITESVTLVVIFLKHISGDNYLVQITKMLECPTKQIRLKYVSSQIRKRKESSSVRMSQSTFYVQVVESNFLFSFTNRGI